MVRQIILLMGCFHSEEQTFPFSSTDVQISSKRKNLRTNSYNGIFSDDRIVQNVRKTQLVINAEDKQMLNRIISEHFLLYRLPKNQRNKFIQCIQIYQCDQHSTIFKKGDNATLFFIIRTGKVQIVKNTSTKNKGQKRKKTDLIILQKGHYFGDLALLYTAVRSATVRSITNCTFFCISNLHFRRTVQQIVKKNYHLAKLFIQKAPLFLYLSHRQKNTLAFNSHFIRFEKNQVIFNEGDDANCVYIITSGKVQVRIPGKAPLQMKAGQSFGENSFGQNQKRSGTALALQLTSLLSIGSQSLKNCLGEQLQQISFYNILKWTFNRSQIFQKASKIQIQQLISSAELKQYKNQEIIIMQGERVDSIVIVLQQKVNNEEVGTIFNTQFLIPQDQNEKDQTHFQMSRRLVKNGKGYVAIIKLKTLFQVLGRQLQNKNKSRSISYERTEQAKKIQLSDLTVISKTGQGQFGVVYQVMDLHKKIYSLKCICKSKIVQNSMQNFMVKEKQILKLLECPYIIKLYKTFKNQNFVYLLTNNIEGVDFFDVLRQIGICNKKKTQFFTSCLILSLEHIHQKNIIYRDLKPENILIDEQGYPNLVDFKISKILSQQNGFRTFTVVGTPHYMAPEVMEVQGYSFAADIWSLGVLFYEMVCGYLPFGNQLDDPYEIFKEIDSKQVVLPSFYIDKSGKQLIQKFLNKNPNQRFSEQYYKIKRLNYFENVNWDLLQQRMYQTPFRIKKNRVKKQIGKPFLEYFQSQAISIMRMQNDWNTGLGQEQPQNIQSIINWDQSF